MSRRAFSLLVVIALTLVMAVAATGTVQAAASKDKAKEKAKHARIVKYWTPARLANAKPRDFVKTDKGFVPAARGGSKPPKQPTDPSDGGDTGGTTVTGADWNGGGAAQSATGKVFFTMSGRNYVCSGAVVQDDKTAESLVLTAGHCVYDETNRAFATNWMFIPNYDDAAPGCSYGTSGCFSAHRGDLFVHPQYATAGGFNLQAIRHDWGFARVSDGGSSLDSKVDEFPIEFDAPKVGRYAFGYPAASPYDGQELVYCAGDVISDRGTGGDTWGMSCNMTPGSSGGPWMKGFSGASGTLNSVNSYKYNGGKYRNYMFGPKFNSTTRDVYNAAIGKGGVAEIND